MTKNNPYDIHDSHKYNSLSNILKNKKMISSPLLDLNFKNNLELKRMINNNHNNYETNEINFDENENNEEKIDKSNENLLNKEIEKIKKEIISIKAKNKILLNELNDEKKKNILLTSLNNNEKENIPNDKELNITLAEISNYLNEDEKKFLAELPEQKEIELSGIKILLVHGSPRRNNENI